METNTPFTFRLGTIVSDSSTWYTSRDTAITLSKKSLAAKLDAVVSPSHYNKNGIEAWDAIKASMTKEEWEGYCKGNIEKYIWRYRYKNGLEDLKKAQRYLEKLIDSVSQAAYNETQNSKT